MENPGPLILDISSDEETGFGGGGKGAEYGIGKGDMTDDDCFWLTRLLDEMDGHKDDDSDDVVVVSEVFPKPCKKSRIESFKPSRKVEGRSNDDDDCMVLDGDPDKPVVLVNVRVGGNEDNGNESDKDSDDIEIVGEKGEVACRDYPHARHLCGKFPFASTQHEVHCSQCHCYVCDCLAPCSHWGTGISTVDHCHANDKEEHWRAERERMKKGGKPMPIIPTASDTSLLEAIFETPQVPEPPRYNSFPLNQGLSPVPVRPYSLSSSAGVPTTVQSRIHPSGHVPMHMPRSDLVSLQSHPIHASVSSRGRSNNTRIRNALSSASHVVVERPWLSGSFPNNRNASASRLHRGSHIRKYHLFQTPLANGRRGPNPVTTTRRTGAPPVLPLSLSSPPGRAVGSLNYLPSPAQMHSRPYSSYPIRDPVAFQSQASSQPYPPTVFGNAMQLQSQPSVDNLENLISAQAHDAFKLNSPFPSQTLASPLSDGATAFGDQLHSESMIPSPSSVGNNFEGLPAQPQTQFSSNTLVINDHNYVEQGNHTRKGSEVSATDFGLDLSSYICGNQEVGAEVSQHQAAAPADGLQLQQPSKDNDHQLKAAIEYSGAVLADNSSQINGTYDHFPENWMFENDSFPGAFEVPFSPCWNEFSPEPAPVGIDTGTLFDI